MSPLAVCAAGSYGSSVANNAGSCTACGPGTYSDDGSATSAETCTACPIGTTGPQGAMGVAGCNSKSLFVSSKL